VLENAFGVSLIFRKAPVPIDVMKMSKKCPVKKRKRREREKGRIIL
jgi:hypothetical protein